MLWKKFIALLKEEDGYGTVELLIMIFAVASIGFTIASRLTKEVFVPMHENSVLKMKDIRNSGY